ncbi:methylamine utilization MauE [Mycolicibacterium rhodesiae JS60]|nr:methylamine utilization MauE [Mycolicibacterium rhodesiae JS60]
MLLLARVVLGLMFTLAVVTKFRDRDGRRQAVAAFGVPARIADGVGWMLLAGEVGIVLALVYAPTAPIGAVAAVGLLVVFSAAIAVNLARGRSPQCHCFGRLSSGPIGWRSVARNGTFATIAVFIAVGGRSGWLLGAIGIALAALWVGPTWRRLWTNRLGAPAADFALADAGGESLSLDSLLGRGVPLVLVFTQAGCAACDALLPDVARWQRLLLQNLTVAVINGGSAAHSYRSAHEHELVHVIADERREVLAAYGVTATPSAILIDPQKRLAGPLAQGAKEIHELIAQSVAASEGQRDLSRRRVLSRVAVGAASVAVFPVVSAIGPKKAAANTNPDALEVDGAWLCNQTFALCTTAPCEPSPTDPGVAVCRCVVENGYSVGFKTCTERTQSGHKVVSNFSTINVNPNFAVLSCAPGIPWANCLDMPCEVDPLNPALANCQCQVVTTGESLTFGGGCDTATCTSTIWSAATPDLPGSTQYKKGMKQLNQAVTFPQTCPKP